MLLLFKNDFGQITLGEGKEGLQSTHTRGGNLEGSVCIKLHVFGRIGPYVPTITTFL